MRVTLTLTPDAISSSMAGTPSGVAGTLTIRLGRPTRRQYSLAVSTLPAVSWERGGGSSGLTKPSPPPVRSQIGRRLSAARWMSLMAPRQATEAGNLGAVNAIEGIAVTIWRAFVQWITEHRALQQSTWPITLINVLDLTG